MLDHHDDEAGPAGAVVAGLDADADHQAFLHREVRRQLAEGAAPADVRILCSRLNAEYAEKCSSWTKAEAEAFLGWHAAAVERWLAKPLVEEN